MTQQRTSAVGFPFLQLINAPDALPRARLACPDSIPCLRRPHRTEGPPVRPEPGPPAGWAVQEGAGARQAVPALARTGPAATRLPPQRQAADQRAAPGRVGAAGLRAARAFRGPLLERLRADVPGDRRRG